MTLDEIIDLYERMERGEEGQMIGYHIHKPVRDTLEIRYGLDSDKRFSDFLKALKEHEKV